MRNADLTKGNLSGTRLWGTRVRNTKLPKSMAHWRVILRFSEVFAGWQKTGEKMRSMREQKRIREVAELVRTRDTARKRRQR